MFLNRPRLESANPDSIFTQRLPEPSLPGADPYRAIVLGFAFFTLATILGALWAVEAWGGYWFWEPKKPEG